MSAQSQSLSWTMLQAARGFGVERGVDLVLHVLFVRWLTTRESGSEQWASLVAAPTQDEMLSQFSHLDIFREEEPSNVADATNYTEVLRRLIDIVDQGVSVNLAVVDQRAIVADAFDEALADLGSLGKQSGESDTPRAVAELMAALTVRPGDQVLDPACGNGTGLLVAAQSQPGVSVSGYDINPRIARRASMRLMVHDIDHGQGFGVWSGDAFLETGDGQADVVLAQPPWGVTFGEHQKKRIGELASAFSNSVTKSANGDMPWLLLALDALKPTGRAAILLSGTSLSTRFRDTHQHLLHSRSVEAIITLPSGVFRHTGIRTALWILRNPSGLSNPDSVLMIDAQTLVTVAEKGQVEVLPEAVSSIAAIVASYRATGEVDAPAHVARAVASEDLDSDRGIDPLTYLAQAPEETAVHPEPERKLLTQVELANFKAFKTRTAVPLAPLTLVYGANSAGKSSVLQSLLLLKQSLDSDALVTQGSMINVGGFKGLVHGHADEEVGIAFTYGVLPSWIPASGTPDPTLLRRVAWAFAANSSGQGPVERYSVEFGEYGLGLTRDRESTDRYSAQRDDLAGVFRGVATGTLLYPFDARQRTDGDEAEQRTRLRSRESDARRALRNLETSGNENVSLAAPGLLPTSDAIFRRGPGESGSREDGIVASYVNRTAKLVGGVSEEVRQLLNSLIWLGPLRSAPQRVYDRADSTGTPGDGRHVAIYLFDHATVVEQVNDWLQRLEIPYTLDVIPVTAGNAANLIGDLVAIALTDTRTRVNVTPADVGFGISQVLPIVVELLARRDSIIAIEQPETHLHPRLQARLADLLIDATQEGGQGNQLVVETHSEHLMLRVQRRIREGALDPKNVAVVYVDQAADGETTVKQLRLNEQGEFLDEWPHGFFDERLDELFGEF